ncbi:MAG: (2Fe-2S) ferredoxin domain-containing protein, partial [Loktanella sp.]|nr:(2Fe-2S) ferredoxin domain-containing protein [Loktanella sp.]
LFCTGPRCAFRGAAPLLGALKAQLAAAGIADRCLTTSTGCLYPCNQGPVIAVYPRGDWFHVPDDIALHRIVRDVLVAGGDAPDLRLTEKPGSRRNLSNPKSDRSVP